MRLDGRCFIITGASRGIGQGIVDGFLAAGASVVAQGRSAAYDTTDSDGRVESVLCDLTDPEAPATLVAAARARFGRVDGLVNNAGNQTLVPFDELTVDDWREMIEVNLTAAHRLTQAVATDLVGHERPGSIVHIASIEARHPTVLHGHYATAKAGLVMHAKAAALAYGPHGIRVNAVLPGLIDRPGLAEAWPEGVERWLTAAPLGRLGSPADIANACVFLCSDQSSFITGTELVVDGGVLTNPTW